MKKRLRSESSGFTLIEMTIAMSIFSAMFVALMSVVASSFDNAQTSRNRVEAIKEAQSVLNDIRSATNLGVPVGVMEAFPEGELAMADTVLPNENVMISYPSGAELPLFVSVSIQWQTSRGRILTETLATALPST